MGNHSSQSSGGSRSSSGGATTASRMTFSTFHRTTGSLGLSKSELEKRCRPSGMYTSCEWEDRAIRRLVGDGKLAARLRGTDSRRTPTDRECPICFLHYSQINVTACCQATLCSECYLQIRPQKEKVCSCPFCNNTKLIVSVAKNMNVAQVAKRDEEEQKVIEATIRARAYSTASSYTEDSHSDGSHNESAGISASLKQDDSNSDSSPNGFGSSLERNSSFQMLHKDSSTLNPATCKIASLAMTPDERRALENEMRAQRSHPLARQMQREADQRRNENDLQYYWQHSTRMAAQRYNRDVLLLRAHNIDPPGWTESESIAGITSGGQHRSQRLQRLSASSSTLSRERRSIDGSGRDWDQIVQAIEDGRNREASGLDEMVVIEAAILLSMEEEAKRRRRQLRAAARRTARDERSNDEDDDDDDEEESNTNSDVEDLNEEAEERSFSTAEHARAGFPLLPHVLARHSDDGDNIDNEGNENVARTLSSMRNRSWFRGISNRSPSTRTLMRGMLEDEQMALAIALSLQEAETQRELDRTSAILEDGEHSGANSSHASSNAVGATADVAEVNFDQDRTTPLLVENSALEVILFEDREEDDNNEAGASADNTPLADTTSVDSSVHDSSQSDDEERSPVLLSALVLASSSMSFS